MRRIIFILCLILVIAGQAIARAEVLSASPKADELQDLLQEALKNNPELKAARDEWKAAQKRVPQASALPDPTAGYSIMGSSMIETRNGPIKNNYEFEQMIPFPGKLVGRRNAAKAESMAAQARMETVEREVMFKVSEAYYDLVTTQKTIVLVHEIKSSLKEEEAALRAGYEANKTSQIEFIKIQMSISDTIQRLFILEQKRDTLEALLQSLLNRPSLVELKTLDLHLPQVHLSLEDILRQARKNRPQLKESQAMAQKSDHILNLAKLENAPDFSIGFQYSRIGVGDSTSANAGRDAWMIPVKITLPIWQNRIGSAIEEAHANLDAARQKLQQTQNSTDYEVKAAYYRFITAEKTVSLYEDALIPQAKIMISSDEAGYEAGRTGVVFFVSNRVNLFNIQIAYYEAVDNALKELAALQREAGTDLISGLPRSAAGTLSNLQ